MKKAFVTGITGQDGSYLAELLLSNGYEVHGLVRRSSSFNTGRIDHLYKDFHDPQAKFYLHYGDLAISGNLLELLAGIRPDEIYHLGAQSHVRVSFDMPEYTGDVTGIGTLRLLEAMRKTGIKARFYQASSSEMFGAAQPPQNEQTPSNRKAPTPLPRFTPIMWPEIIGRPTIFFPATVSYSITNPHGEERRS